MSNDLEQQVQQEIDELHEFFVGWFSGAIAEPQFNDAFLSRFCEDVVFIPPAGVQLGLTDLISWIKTAHGSNTDFRIAIRNVKVHCVMPTHVLATYEEWQRNAINSTPPDNGRIATVLFERGEGLRWRHIHETWLPAEQIAAGPYDF